MSIYIFIYMHMHESGEMIAKCVCDQRNSVEKEFRMLIYFCLSSLLLMHTLHQPQQQHWHEIFRHRIKHEKNAVFNDWTFVPIAVPPPLKIVKTDSES